MKKICAVILIISILFLSIDQQKKDAQAFIPILPIVMGMSELEALTCLIASGVVIQSVPAAVDLANRYAVARASSNVHFEQGLLAVSAVMIDHARSWIESLLPTLSETVVSVTPHSTIGSTFSGTYPYSATPITHRFLDSVDFSTVCTKQIEIIGFGNITDWMTYYDNLESTFDITFPGTTDYFRINLRAFDALLSWSIGGIVGSRLYDQYPSDYIALNDRFRFDITTSFDEMGALMVTILPRFHELGNEETQWTDDSFLPVASFPTTDATISLDVNARPMSNVTLDVQTLTTYPKVDIAELAYPTTVPVSVPIPTTWDDVLTGEVVPEDPPVDPPVGLLDSILDFLAKLLAALLAIPALIAQAISDVFTTGNTGDTLDFTKLQLAANLFTNKFPFSLPWDLKRMVQSFGSHSTAAPSIPIAFSSIDTDLSLERFNDIAAAVRVFELFIFNIGLLFGTRKLLGGAS